MTYTYLYDKSLIELDLIYSVIRELEDYVNSEYHNDVAFAFSVQLRALRIEVDSFRRAILDKVGA